MARGFQPYQRTRLQAAQKAPSHGKVDFLLAGLAQPNRGGTYLSAFQSGLAGALGQRQADYQAQQQAEQDQLQQDLNERLYGLQERQTGATELQAQAAMERAQNEPAGSKKLSFDQWKALSPEDQKLFSTYSNVTDNPVQIPYAQTRDEEIIKTYIEKHPGATRADAIAATTYDKPVVVEREYQSVNADGEREFIDAKGNITSDSSDPVTGKPNKPRMLTARVTYGSREDTTGGIDQSFIREGR